MTTEHSTAAPAFPYELRTFPVESVDGKVSDDFLAWTQAVSMGFYGKAISPGDALKYVQHEAVDRRMAMGAYIADGQTPSGAWGPEYPVATYAYHRKDLNVGGGTLLPVHQITAVTVRASHRRRGILRAMITADLARAKAEGLPIAALTASEATIYGRFGFGVATHACEIELDTRNGIAFHNPAAAAKGVVEVAEATVVRDLHNGIFARVHAASYGSIGRHDMYRLVASGQGNYGSMEAAPNVRAALHYDESGEVDGYVTYKPAEPAVEVVDLLAATDSAYLALWNYLGSLDLIQSVKWKMAPVADPLEWAVAAKRGYKRTDSEDHLWLRILDVPAALSAREYLSDGSVIISVADPLGHADGVFRLTVEGGTAAVEPIADAGEAELSMGVGELSSLYLGGVTARTLHAAGRIREGVPGAVDRFDRLFAPAAVPHSMTNF